MRIRTATALACAAVLTALAPLARAGGIPYELDPEASFTQGCYPPCLCALVFADDVTGTFDLTLLGSTPDGYDHYALDVVDWTIAIGSQTLRATGTGLYDVGGQFIPQERLQLDLSIDGGPLEHFDSGLVVGGSAFPRIDVVVSMNGMVCYDRVFRVAATPVPVGTPYCTGAPNSVGAGAAIDAVGSAVVADNDLHLLATGAPPIMPGLFLFGSASAQLPFGDGFLCVQPPLGRLQPPILTDPEGCVLRTLDLSAPPAAGKLLPGTTWYFQLWYRDPPGGPAGFNTTNGTAVDLL